MSKNNSTAIAMLTALILAAGVGLAVQHSTTKNAGAQSAAMKTSASTDGTGSSATPAGPAQKTSGWAASAPGRIEPKGGDYRIGAQVAGRVVEVLVQMNDRVMAGDLLVRIDDEDAQARLVAAEAETAVRRRERDAETVGRLAQDRRNADDLVASAERGLFQARRDLDRTQSLRRTTGATEDDVVKARASVTAARDKLETERTALRRVQLTVGMPLPTRLESGFAVARTELLLIETAIERARVRAAFDGTALQVFAKVGEIVAPSPEAPLVVMGDVSSLRVRAEVEERDVSRVRVGQKVVIRSDAFPGRDYSGTVTTLGQSLAPPRLPSRGPRRPTDVDALEVLVNVEGVVALMPGMRVDVFFVPDAVAQPVLPTKTN